MSLPRVTPWYSPSLRNAWAFMDEAERLAWALCRSSGQALEDGGLTFWQALIEMSKGNAKFSKELDHVITTPPPLQHNKSKKTHSTQIFVADPQVVWCCGARLIGFP